MLEIAPGIDPTGVGAATRRAAATSPPRCRCLALQSPEEGGDGLARVADGRVGREREVGVRPEEPRRVLGRGVEAEAGRAGDRVRFVP